MTAELYAALELDALVHWLAERPVDADVVRLLRQRDDWDQVKHMNGPQLRVYYTRRADEARVRALARVVGQRGTA